MKHKNLLIYVVVVFLLCVLSSFITWKVVNYTEHKKSSNRIDSTTSDAEISFEVDGKSYSLSELWGVITDISLVKMTKTYSDGKIVECDALVMFSSNYSEPTIIYGDDIVRIFIPRG